jgi:hypothetical protein
MQQYKFIYICKLLYVFRVVTPLIIRSSCHYLQYLERVWLVVPRQTRSRQVAIRSQ